MKSLVSAALAEKTQAQITPKGTPTVKASDGSTALPATGGGLVPGESDSHNENSTSQLKTDKDMADVNGDIDEENEEKSSSEEGDSDLNDKDSVSGDNKEVPKQFSNKNVIQQPELTKTNGSAIYPPKGSSGPTSPNALNNTGGSTPGTNVLQWQEYRLNVIINHSIEL